MNSSIALSGMNTAMLRMDVAAHNVANLQTPGFRRQQVLQQTQDGGGVTSRVVQHKQAANSLEADVVNQLTASYAFIANLRTIQTEQAMLGSLLDVKA